jgi:lysophospholipase L1-like esterase
LSTLTRTSFTRLVALNALALLVFAVLGGAILEIFCRTVVDDGRRFEFEMWRYAKALKIPGDDPDLPFSHRPNGRAHIMGADVAINSLGLRDDRDISREKPAGVTRIVMLGDSVTFGFGVSGRETTASQLETLLATQRTPSRIEVLNAGVGNYNTSMEVNAYLRSWRALQPDVVLLNFFVNDAEPTPVPRGNLFTRYSLAAVYIGSRLDAVSLLTNGAPGWQEYYTGLFDDRQPGWVKAQAAIAALKAACDADGRPLLMVNYPDLHQTKPYPLSSITAKLAALADRLSIPFLDLTPEVADQEDAALLWVNGGDPHPNAATNARYARRIAEWLLPRLPPETVRP